MIGRRLSLVLVVSCAIGLVPLAALTAADPEPRGPRAGRLVRVTAPISSSVRDRVLNEAGTFIDHAKQRGEWPVVVFEIEPGPCEFGEAFNLATQVLKLEGATTVAYAAPDAEGRPQTLSGFPLLVAVACEQLALHPDAVFAGLNEKPAKTHVAAFAEIAEARGMFPADLAVAMVDPAVEIWEIERAQGGLDFVRAERLPEIRKSKDVIVRKRWFEAGKPRSLKGQDLAAMGLVHRDRLVTDRKQLAQALDLPPEAMEYDPLFGTTRRAVVFPLTGKLKPSDVSAMQGKIQAALDHEDINLVILEINSPGGAPDESMNLANFLRGSVQGGKRRTVAYITGEASGDALFFAVACDTILMLPGAMLGGQSAIGAENIPLHADGLAGIAQEKGRSPSLAKALIDPGLRVYRYERDDGVSGYFTEADLQRQPDPRRWRQQEEIEKQGETLTLEAPKAVKLRMATDQVQSYEELKDLLGLTSDPPRVATTWLDVLLTALQNEWLLGALLMIGIVAFYAEMNSPGSGVGGLIATVCFLLYFWGNFLGGSAGWLEVLMFLVGVVLILIELFVLPGFGIVGLGGGILVLLSLVMAMHTFHGLPASAEDMLELRRSLTVVTLAAIGALAGAALLRRYLPATPVLSELILAPPDASEAQRQELQRGPARYDHLLGEIGVAVTQLTPSGKARFGDELWDVITEGEVIDRGQSVIVVECVGSRIVVRAAR